jgi:WD40 repeat protein
MCSTLINLGENFYAVFGTSSGQVLFYKINFTKRRLEEDQLKAFQFKSPVLSMKRISKSGYIACGLTNGDVVVINTNLGSLLVTCKVHDFGVNSLDARLNSSSSILIASGGDDQQISITYLDITTKKIIHKKSYAHSSSIKGVTMWRQSENTYMVASSGYDQRYKEWIVRLDNDEIKFEKGRVQRHCMSDMNGIGKIKEAQGKYRNVLVGQGLAIF